MINIVTEKKHVMLMYVKSGDMHIILMYVCVI